MSETNRTAAEWLAIPEDKLLGKLQDALPGLVKLDWNTAMEWARKSDRHSFSNAIEAVFCETHESQSIGRMWWMQFYAQPEDYLKAAAIAKGESDDNS